MVVAAVFYAAIFLFSYGLAAYFGDGTGTLSYPVLLGPQVDWLADPPAPFYKILPLRAYMRSAAVLYLAFVFFVLALVNGITGFVKNRLRSLLLIGLVLFLGVFLSKNSALLRYADSVSAFSAFPFYQPFALFYVEAFLQSLSVPVYIPVLLLLSYGLLMIPVTRFLEKQNAFFPQTRRTKGVKSFLAKWESGRAVRERPERSIPGSTERSQVCLWLFVYRNSKRVSYSFGFKRFNYIGCPNSGFWIVIYKSSKKGAKPC